MAKQTDRGLENREIVLDVLMEVLERGSFIHLVLGQALKKYQYLDKADRAFISRVSEGTVEYLIQIDEIINRYSKTSTQKMKPVIRNLLRLSVYQIVYMDRVPDRAACSEAVKLAQKRRFGGLKGFVNGVLRTISREKEGISFREPWVELSLPRWLYEMWEGQYGKEVTGRMGRAFLEEDAETTVWVKPEMRGEALESLASQGVRALQDSELPDLLKLSGYDYLESLEAFRKGWLQVQDRSSYLAGVAAPPEKESFVLDVCAAPGGKSLHMAQLMDGKGCVEARDLTDRKRELIEENVRRSGFQNVYCKTWDARIFDESMEGRADLVIADLPCSGLGILGKKPDIRWNMSPQQMRELAGLQREILSVVWRYVKPGGRLIYSTCTINPKENQDNAAWFLSSFPFEPVDLRKTLGEYFKEDSLEKGWIQLLPGIHRGDGFFISVFRRAD